MNKPLDELKEADKNYWAGKPTGMSDAEFDRQAKHSGMISQPRARGWARFQKAKLSRPNFGLKKIYGESALADYTAGLPPTIKPRYRPKYDGIYVDISWGSLVTRGDGRVGLDITDWCRFKGHAYYWSVIEYCGELVLPKPYGRADLVRAIAADEFPPARPIVISHDYIRLDGLPPLDIPPTYHVPGMIPGDFDVDIDGWVIDFGIGELVAYKKNNI